MTSLAQANRICNHSAHGGWGAGHLYPAGASTLAFDGSRTSVEATMMGGKVFHLQLEESFTDVLE